MDIDKGCFKRNPDFVYRKVIEETILVPVHMDIAEMDGIYTLNEIGAFVWEQLETPLSFDHLQNLILDEYDVTPELAASDLKIFLGELLAIGALQMVENELS